MYSCVSQIMEQDYTATRGRPEFCILTLFQYINKMSFKKMLLLFPLTSQKTSETMSNKVVLFHSKVCRCHKQCSTLIKVVISITTILFVPYIEQ